MHILRQSMPNILLFVDIILLFGEKKIKVLGETDREVCALKIKTSNTIVLVYCFCNYRPATYYATMEAFMNVFILTSLQLKYG